MKIHCSKWPSGPHVSLRAAGSGLFGKRSAKDQTFDKGLFGVKANIKEIGAHFTES
jgi:hypothetical protein